MVKEPVSLWTAPFNVNEPVIVRVKRKSYQSPVEAFWLEINERPVKRPLLDFDKLSIIDSASKAEEVKPKKFFVQHVDSMSSSNVAADVLQSFVASKHNSAVALDFKAKYEDQRRSNKADNKQKQLLVKAKETQEVMAKNARVKQLWKSRKGKDSAASADALHVTCHLYDVEGTGEVHKQEDEEDHRQMYSFLTLLQEFIPSAADDIDSDIEDHMIKQASKDDYVYDLYAVKDNISMVEENALSPLPSVRVDDIGDVYDGPDDLDFEDDGSNAKENPMNDYPDEEEGVSEISEQNSGVVVSRFSRSEKISYQALSEDDILINFDEDDDEGYW